MTSPTAIIVVGASAGGVEALRTVVAGLPIDLDAAVFITLHIGAHRSDLPWLLSRAGLLPASHPVDGEEIRAGHVYVAPPDHHMLVEVGSIHLTKGPRENCARPAVDPLFRSAARAYGSGVIGVILTGGLNDGTAGMYEVKAQGGTTVVQDPADSVTPNMPQSVIANVAVDYVAPVKEIGALLARLVTDRGASQPTIVHATGDSQERGMTAAFTLNQPVAVTCPDCGGALRQSELGTLTQFSCHIGHVYTAEVMLAAQFLAMERALETAMRSLSERAELCRHMRAKVAHGADRDDEREQWDVARRQALDMTEPLRTLLTLPWIHPSGGQRSQQATSDGSRYSLCDDISLKDLGPGKMSRYE
jgi:two-component system chemotaxis response regulator CheB